MKADAYSRAPEVQRWKSESYWTELLDLVGDGRITGQQVHDARIAALCLYHGIEELWSADRDFNRFPELRVRNPLISEIADARRYASGEHFLLLRLRGARIR